MKIRPTVALSRDDRLPEQTTYLIQTMKTPSKSTKQHTETGNKTAQDYLHGFTKCTKTPGNPKTTVHGK